MEFIPGTYPEDILEDIFRGYPLDLSAELISGTYPELQDKSDKSG